MVPKTPVLATTANSDEKTIMKDFLDISYEFGIITTSG